MPEGLTGDVSNMSPETQAKLKDFMSKDAALSGKVKDLFPEGGDNSSNDIASLEQQLLAGGASTGEENPEDMLSEEGDVNAESDEENTSPNLEEVMKHIEMLLPKYQAMTAEEKIQVLKNLLV